MQVSNIESVNVSYSLRSDWLLRARSRMQHCCTGWWMMSWSNWLHYLIRRFSDDPRLNCWYGRCSAPVLDRIEVSGIGRLLQCWDKIHCFFADKYCTTRELQSSEQAHYPPETWQTARQLRTAELGAGALSSWNVTNCPPIARMPNSSVDRIHVQ